MAVKLVPGGHPYHALAEAAANAARKAQAAAEVIKSITVSTSPCRRGIRARRWYRPPSPARSTRSRSVRSRMSSARRRDGAGGANATPAKIADPVNAERYRQGATVTIALPDGRSFTSTVYAPKGSGQLGIAWNDIDAK